MSSGKSYLTGWQRRALEATARGEVKRSFVAEGSTLKCPAISSATLWFLLRTNFLTDGPREGGITTMILTKKGERFLSPPSEDVDQLIALAKASLWRSGGDAAKLTSAQRRALEATQRGTVTRIYTSRDDKFFCPTVGARAIWSLLNAGLIANGPKNGDRVQMVLTPKGEAAIAATSPSSLFEIAGSARAS
jgi:hypothetical protein